MSLSVSVSPSHPVVAGDSELHVVLRFTSESSVVVRRPLNLSLVLDRSGSMGGTPLFQAVEAAKMVVDRLQPQDRLSVVTYDDEIQTVVPSQPVTDPAAIKAALDRIRAGGLTNLCGGWLRGCDNVKSGKTEDSIDRVMLLTDGQANVGTTDTASIVSKAKGTVEQGVSTTTLGFGSNFNEDLLIGMAEAARGNFYYIQSPEHSKDVFYIEVEGLASLVADHLVILLEPAPGVIVSEVLNGYETFALPNGLAVEGGEVYGAEPRSLHVALKLSGVAQGDSVPVLRASYRYRAAEGGKMQDRGGAVDLQVRVGTADEAAAAVPDTALMQEIARLRIGRIKEEAAALADRGRAAEAVTLLRTSIERFRTLGLHTSFEFAEELDLLDHYAVKLSQGSLSASTRKEIKDQSYQARTRDRGDLQQRGLSEGSTAALPAVTAAAGEEGAGVVLECVAEGAKLRVRVVGDGYDAALNVQFPRAIRQAGARYLVGGLELSDGGFYRTTGDVQLLLRPGESRPAAGASYGGGGSSRAARSSSRKSTAVSLADLEQTTDVGDGVLIQVVKEGSKLRARVVSDGYDPNLNMRFPRAVREVGRLFVADEVKPSADGSYYLIDGQLRLLIQPGQTT